MLKTTIALVCALLTIAVCHAQKNDTIPTKDTLKVVEEKVYEMFDVEKQPEFPGGQEGLYKYLAENVKYPEAAKTNNKSGMAALTFVIEKDGTVSTVNVIRDPGMGMGDEAKRVVSVMPKWLPAEMKGKPVRVKFTLPVRFKLE